MLAEEDDNTHDGVFSFIPEEIIRLIYSFADIPTLGRLGSLNKRGWLSRYAADDKTWKEVAQERFCVSVARNPRFHGGSRWKDAYQSMSKANRIPRSRYTPARRIVFAKGGGNGSSLVEGETRRLGGQVFLWVMINHTENCTTRRQGRRPIFPPDVDYEDSSLQYSERIIELNVCIQNVKSSSGPIMVDWCRSRLSFLTDSASLETQHRTEHRGCAEQPKLVYLRRKTTTTSSSSNSNSNSSCIHGDSTGIQSLHGHDDELVLNPFDFCVVSLHFPCRGDVFETDFLARALALHVPFMSNGEPSMATATFMQEKDIWNCYTELPGGFLSLNDKFRLLAA